MRFYASALTFFTNHFDTSLAAQFPYPNQVQKKPHKRLQISPEIEKEHI
jgi:hypothetical protein